ncbi:MAG: DNA primase [Paracoccaceae bacterium]
MSLPSGFLDELRNRVPIAQVIGRKLSWDARKSNPGKGDYWASCPFHHEKTASFHVDDRKGFYYCFGCHAKGDALSFVRETENVGFMEAVEILAREAGMTVPAPDPKARARDDRRRSLADVMEQAVKHYRLQLRTGPAAAAREYLQRRGLSDADQARFEIGFAREDRAALHDHLTGNGVSPEELVEAGLCVRPEDGGQPYDRFRGRIMFPIRDARGRCIAFGGRAMDPNARAKYLNSPETALFDKGRTLFNIGPAREAAGKTGALIVAEGYMDVIALARAGFAHAVAPLGTAITEDQLRLMWRIADEPVIALDGDTAGLRAAMRLVDLALPMLVAGKSLRFCILPEGQDPDDLVSAGGAAAFQAQLDQARPMVDLLWQRETEGKVFDSPERRAALDAALRRSLAQIRDASIAAHYRAAIRALRAELFRPAGTAAPAGRRRGRTPPVQGAAPDTRASLLAQRNASLETAARIRESAILAGCMNHPDIARQFESELESSPFLCSDLDQIRRAVLQLLAEPLDKTEDAGFADGVNAKVGFDVPAKLAKIGHIRANRHLGPGAVKELAEKAIAEELTKQSALVGIDAEIREAEQELGGVADEGLTWRLHQAGTARDRAVTAPLAEDPAEQSADAGLSEHLQDLIDRKIWEKDKGR